MSRTTPPTTMKHPGGLISPVGVTRTDAEARMSRIDQEIERVCGCPRLARGGHWPCALISVSTLERLLARACEQEAMDDINGRADDPAQHSN
jgi:hypothetical protein